MLADQDGHLNFSTWLIKNILFEQRERQNYEMNGILWKIQLRLCTMSSKSSKFPCRLNIYAMNY